MPEWCLITLVYFNILINDLKVGKIGPVIGWRERMKEDNKITAILMNQLKMKRKVRGRMKFNTKKDKRCCK